jgi:hypothetical protein
VRISSCAIDEEIAIKRYEWWELSMMLMAWHLSARGIHRRWGEYRPLHLCPRQGAISTKTAGERWRGLRINEAR